MRRTRTGERNRITRQVSMAKNQRRPSGCMAVFGLLFFALLFCGGGMVAVIYVASKDRKPDAAGSEAAVEGEKLDVRVTSQIVKKVDGNHRYFFRIQNHDSK